MHFSNHGLCWRMGPKQLIHLSDLSRDIPALLAQSPSRAAFVDAGGPLIVTGVQRGTAGNGKHARASRMAKSFPSLPIAEAFLSAPITETDRYVNEDGVGLVPLAPDLPEVRLNSHLPHCGADQGDATPAGFAAVDPHNAQRADLPMVSEERWHRVGDRA
jgi:hypothetical protein